MKLYYHPRSRYSQKVLIALYEKAMPFTPIVLFPGDPADRAELRKLTPLGKVPLLVLEDGWKIPESTTIIEYLDPRGSGPRLIPEDLDLARQARFHDRITDLYVTESIGTLVHEPTATERVARAKERLEAMFTGFDAHLAERQWVMGDTFTLADCSLIPALANFRDAYPYDKWKHVTAYFQRSLERPSVARVRRELAAHEAKVAS
ncbi:MAG: glutathione S-transferase family protein [Kofleriaceae bacterium]